MPLAPYTVKPGDSFSKIAAEYHTTVDEIVAINGYNSAEDTIRPGDSLYVIDNRPDTQHAEKVLATCGNESGSSGKCPARTKIAIVPVRYAIDESPQKKQKKVVSPNPIPSDWQPQNTHPSLNTRNYTLRQLRDGWLYVWNATTKTLYEYQIQGPNLTLKEKTDGKGKTVAIDSKEGGTQKYIEFLGNSKLYLSYSPIKATERVKKELVQHSSKWTRELDLTGFCQGTLQPNTQLISNISHYVADVSSASKKVGDFSTTTLPTQKVTTHDTFKSSTTEDALKAAVPNVDDALFIALEDPLAIVDDLTMQLAGRWSEQLKLEKEKQHKTEIALICLELTGISDLKQFVPERVKQTPSEMYKCLKDINAFFKTVKAHYDRYKIAGTAMSGAAAAGNLGIFIGTADYIPNGLKSLQEKWGINLTNSYDAYYDKWVASAPLQESIHIVIDDVLDFLIEINTKMENYIPHIENAQQDLFAWLNLIDTEITHIFFDNTDKQQASQLIDKTDTLYSFLAMTKTGQEWIANQCATPESLFALASYNFSKNIQQCIDKATDELWAEIQSQQNPKPNMSEEQMNQWLVDNIANNDNLGFVRFISNATNVASRSGEIDGAWGKIKETKLYKKLLDNDKKALDVHREIAASTEMQPITEGITAKTVGALGGADGAAATESAATASKTPPKKVKLILREALVSAVVNDQNAGNRFKLGINKDYQWLQPELKRLKHNLTSANSKDRRTLKNDDAELDTSKKLSTADRNKLTNRIQERTQLRTALGSEKAPAFYLELVNRSGISTEEAMRLQTEMPGLLEKGNEVPHSTAAKATPNTTAAAAIPSTVEELKVQKWIKKVGGSFPILVAAFNIANLWATNEAAKAANYNTSAKLDLTSAAGYTGNALASLYVIPYWDKLSTNAALLSAKKGVVDVVKVGFTKWAKVGNTEFAALGRGLALRVSGLSALALIGAGVEFYQVYNNDYLKATSAEESKYLRGKLVALGGMAFLAGAQLGWALFLAPWLSFSWVLSTPVGLIVAALGVAYLVFSLLAAQYKREGLILWIYRCRWGQNKDFWPNTEQGYLSELCSLFKFILQPVVTSLRNYTIKNGVQDKTRLWLSFQFPAILAEKAQAITIDSLLVDASITPPVPDGKFDSTPLIQNGRWITAPADGKVTFPEPNTSYQLPPEANYTSADKLLIWYTWVDLSGEILHAIYSGRTSPALEFKISYPAGTLIKVQNSDLTVNNDYIFSIDLTEKENNEELLTDYYSMEEFPEKAAIPRYQKTSQYRLQTLLLPTITAAETQKAKTGS